MLGELFHWIRDTNILLKIAGYVARKSQRDNLSRAQFGIVATYQPDQQTSVSVSLGGSTTVA